MSKLSIYSSSWINLVFEGKNKEYGAFELRSKSNETTLLAFCLVLFFMASVFSLSIVVSHFFPNDKPQLTNPEFEFANIHLSNYKPNKPQAPVKFTLPPAVKRPTDFIKESLKDPEIVPAEAANLNIAKPGAPTTPVNTNSGDNTDKGTAITTFVNGTGTEKPIVPVVDSNELVTATADLDKLPEFPGGLNKFYTYVGENFANLEVDESVTVLTSFVIEKDGSMTDIKVMRKSTPAVDREAIRVLKALHTKWKPGIKDGKPVRTLYQFPIKVKK